MSIKIKILKENKIEEGISDLLSMVASAIGLSSGEEVSDRMAQGNAAMQDVDAIMGSGHGYESEIGAIGDRLDAKTAKANKTQARMNKNNAAKTDGSWAREKLKKMKADRGLPAELTESIMSMLTDPMVIAGLVVAAGMGKAVLDNAVNTIKQGNESPDHTFKRIIGDDWRDKAREKVEQEKASTARARKKFDQMMADRAAALGDGAKADEVPDQAMLNLGAPVDAADVGGALSFPALGDKGTADEKATDEFLKNDVRVYTHLMNQVRSGDALVTHKTIQALRAKYGKDAIEAASKEAVGDDGKKIWYSPELRESFRRFL